MFMNYKISASEHEHLNMLGIVAGLSQAEGCMHIVINVYMFWTWTHTLHGTVYIEKNIA